MRTANLDDRLVLVYDDGVVDVEKASDGEFPSDPQAVFDRWPQFRDWAQSDVPAAYERAAFDERQLGPPAPRPRQVFAVALNYADHVAESAADKPAQPTIFTKYPTSVTGPRDTVALPSETVDWEIELVAVIGTRAHQVAAADVWGHVAGLTVGQDLSERRIQLRGSPAQFSLGKSFPGFSPIGPVLVTPDEFENPDDLPLGCAVNGETMQESRTSHMIFSVSEQIAWISGICPLLPGDLVFTGTPSGVGGARNPMRFLRPGEELRSWIEGIGELRNPLIAGRSYPHGPQSA
ncbi:fumarylacetoacetate hydrolase family protein [Streptomyces sp. x-80]|uniref:fumarylacetoacetate hydrolase family protein n=1 Tax=Streptomyces sp. x-80 TaxID=2789282 RepID=UPI003981676A